MSAAFRITPGRWHAWTQRPGYAASEYRSPIFVWQWRQLAADRFHIEFWNSFYAAGCQPFALELAVVNTTPNQLEAVRDDGRCITVDEISYDWMRRYFPALVEQCPIRERETLADYLCRFTGYKPRYPEPIAD